MGMTTDATCASNVSTPLNVNVTNANSNGQTTMASSSPVVIASDQSAIAVKPPSTARATLVQGTTAAMTGTTSTQVVALTTSKITYITAIHCNNSSATATLVQIRDGAAGSVLDTLAAGATYGGDNRSSSMPLFWTSSGVGLYAQNVTTSASVICQASGYAE